MKNKRQVKILEFIKQYPVQTRKSWSHCCKITVCCDSGYRFERYQGGETFKAINKDGLSVYTSNSDVSDDSHEA